MSDDLISRAAQEHCAKLIAKRAGGDPNAAARLAMVMAVRTPDGNVRLDPAALKAVSDLRSNNIRFDKVSPIKAQIADGSYDPDGKKLDRAIDNLLADLNG